MTDHAGVRSRIGPDGIIVVEGHCSCRHVTDAHPGNGIGMATAARELYAHLLDCPDEGIAIEVSVETEAWAELHYSDKTCTLDEWRARYG